MIVKYTTLWPWCQDAKTCFPPYSCSDAKIKELFPSDRCPVTNIQGIYNDYSLSLTTGYSMPFGPGSLLGVRATFADIFTRFVRMKVLAIGISKKVLSGASKKGSLVEKSSGLSGQTLETSPDWLHNINQARRPKAVRAS